MNQLSADLTRTTPSRQPNAVTVLRSRIAEIQNNCQHKYQSSHTLPKTPFRKILQGSREDGHVRYFTITCLECEMSKEVSAFKTCPTCCSPTEKVTGAKSTLYFNSPDSYYACYLFDCTNPECAQRIALLEYDR